MGAPGAGELRIRVDAIGLNRAEVMFREGGYFYEPTFPSSLGYEAAGVVCPRTQEQGGGERRRPHRQHPPGGSAARGHRPDRAADRHRARRSAGRGGGGADRGGPPL
ncbi:alcohol dehydrogenase catalytic domain-containing protein [Streptomyces sp. NPDC020845]|uniref:alcohol dehydrogenase catalytic domain-containing protein n=1 Tax=Streptomyces sp. NPDC020845 TaxID=3365096 RepID=UPI0037BC4B80